jgi:hypothetical protein
MPSFMPVPSAWFTPLIGELEPMSIGALSAVTHTGCASRSSQTEPPAQSVSVEHGIGTKLVEHADEPMSTKAFAMRKPLMMLLSQVWGKVRKAG